eukprot:gene10512-4335_t
MVSTLLLAILPTSAALSVSIAPAETNRPAECKWTSPSGHTYDLTNLEAGFDSDYSWVQDVDDGISYQNQGSAAPRQHVDAHDFFVFNMNATQPPPNPQRNTFACRFNFNFCAGVASGNPNQHICTAGETAMCQSDPETPSLASFSLGNLKSAVWNEFGTATSADDGGITIRYSAGGTQNRVGVLKLACKRDAATPLLFTGVKKSKTGSVAEYTLEMESKLACRPAAAAAAAACKIEGPSYNTAGSNMRPAPGSQSPKKVALPILCANLCDELAGCDGFHYYGKGDPAGWDPVQGVGDCYLESGVTSLAGPLNDGRVRYAGICPNPPSPPPPSPSPPPLTCPGVNLADFCRSCDNGDVKGACIGADPDYCCGNTDPSAGPTNPCTDCNVGFNACDAAKVCGNTPPSPPSPPPSPPPPPPSPPPLTCPGINLADFCRSCDNGDVKGACIGADPDYCCGNTDPSAGPTNPCTDCNVGFNACDAVKVCGNTPPSPPSPPPSPPPPPPSPPPLPECTHEDSSTGLKYDLSVLQRAGPFVVETDETPKLKYKHSIGICNTGGECMDPNIDPTRPQVAACQTLLLNPPVPEYTFANGYLSNMKIENIGANPFGAQGLVITYTGSTDNQCRSNANTRGLRTTVVEVMCSAQPISPDPILKYISEDPKCSYNYVLESIHGCATATIETLTMGNVEATFKRESWNIGSGNPPQPPESVDGCILAYGDSLTAGLSDNGCTFNPYGKKLELILGFPVGIVGAPGASAAELLAAKDESIAVNVLGVECPAGFGDCTPASPISGSRFNELADQCCFADLILF